jgi:hypothetical protein
MNSLKLSSIFLFLGVLVLAIFLGGKHINKSIQETIELNYQSEIDALKDKLSKHSELINSIIGINDKNDDNSDNNQNSSVISTTSTTSKNNSSTISTKIEDEFEYINENGGITITKYIGSNTTVKIPNTINKLPVIKIGENAFANTKVKSVTIPLNCAEIDWFAFYGCYSLNTVYISGNVTSIAYGAFDSCSKSLTIYCEKESFAQKYAQSFGISYSYFD